MIRIWTPLALLIMLTACQATESESTIALPAGLTECKDPRPQMCTMNYLPVCAFEPLSNQWREASNACGACSDPQVAGYLDGACSGAATGGKSVITE